MSTKRIAIQTRFLSMLSIGLVLSASAGCGQTQDQTAVTDKSAIGWEPILLFQPSGDTGTGQDWDAFFSDMGQLFDDAKVVANFYSGAGAVISGAETLGHLLGILAPPEDPSVKIIKALNQIAVGLSWQISEEALETSYGNMQAAIQTIDTATRLGMTYGLSSPGYQDSVSSVADVEQPIQYQHVSTTDGNRGGDLSFPTVMLGTVKTNWKTLISDRPPVDGMNLVYDWRRAVPLLMKMISMRLFVIGIVDPNFRTDHVFDTELTAHREALKGHYDTISKGIKCASHDFVDAQKFHSNPAGCNIVCADIYTGISAITTFRQDVNAPGAIGANPLPGFENYFCSQVQKSQPAAYANAVNSLAWKVRSKLPLFQLRSMIDQLYMFLHPSYDLTQLRQRISSEPAQNLCVDVPGANTANGTPLQLYPCNGGANQQWTYDRTTGQIKNGIGTCMDQRFAVNPGSVPGTWACDVPQGDPARISNTAQMWSYDPESRTLMNGLGTTLMASSFTQGAPLWNDGQAMGVSGFSSALTRQNGDLAWRADQVLPSSSCGTLQAGEGLNAGGGLYSCNGRFELVQATNGDLLLWQLDNGPTLIWQRNFGLNGGSYAIMQGDGNFVVYPGPGITAAWATNTVGFPGARLVVHNDGDIVVYDASGILRWTSNTSPYAYTPYVFDNGTSWGYTGAGDWAYGEYKGGCAANQWSMGVSAAADGSSRAHSLLCASAGSPLTFTSNLHTLNISSANDGYGTHVDYDWDPGTYKGECAPNEVMVGLSQSVSGGALLHARCAAAGSTAFNCQPLVFPGNDNNQESLGDPTDWAPGYFKTECARGRAVAGVSRTVATGAVHAILCCDYAGL
jgi:hypothetical protein